MVAVIFLLYQSSRDGTQLELSFLSEYQVTLNLLLRLCNLYSALSFIKFGLACLVFFSFLVVGTRILHRDTCGY